MERFQMNSIFSRRAFISGAASTAAFGPFFQQEILSSRNAPTGGSRSPQENSLKDLASRHGIFYGAAATRTHLSSDAAFAASFVDQCALLVPEVELKWDALRPTPDSF